MKDRLRNDFLGYIILIFMVSSTYLIHSGLASLRVEIGDTVSFPKIKITDTTQFNRLCEQFTEQWGGTHFAFYILQPNSTFKTHKEKSIVSESIKYNLPNRTPIGDEYTSLYRGEEYAVLTTGDLDELLIGNTLDSTYKTIVIPIHQNSVIIGELYIFYDNDEIVESIDAQVSEAQQLNQLLY